jgi:chorismate-pyruvate lyase
MSKHELLNTAKRSLCLMIFIIFIPWVKKQTSLTQTLHRRSHVLVKGVADEFYQEEIPWRAVFVQSECRTLTGSVMVNLAETVWIVTKSPVNIMPK